MTDVPSFDVLLERTTQTAFHLEQRDVWELASPTHRASFKTFMASGTADDDPDGPFWSTWTTMVRAAVARGVEFRRLRIVSEPITDYIRWEHAITGANIAAGEQVRWLPRSQCTDFAVVPVDHWILDSQVVRFGLFSGNGATVGHQLRTEPDIAKLVADTFETAWSRGIPHAQYDPT